MRSPTHVRTRRWLPAAALASGLALVATTTLTGASPATADSGKSASKKLRTAVTPAGITEHLQALQKIADANDGNRASGTDGYAASRDYVVKKLRAAGYKPRVQTFAFPFFEERSESTLKQVSPEPRTYVNGPDFRTMTYSDSGLRDGRGRPDRHEPHAERNLDQRLRVR